MQYRRLGRTGFTVSTVSFGAWAIGGSWGETDDEESMAALHKAIDMGVNFIDTADVYGDGRSERLVARLRRERPGEEIIVATKAGRRLDPHTADAYTGAAIAGFVERSLQNLEVEALDLLQLHCPPTEVYYRPELFAELDELVAAGKLRNYGVSVEKVEEALKAIEFPGVKSVQIIFNMYRQRPAERFFAEAALRDVGILARVPLASGLLTGKMRHDTQFAPDDHRAFNRHGEAFDRGETFSGVDYATGVQAAARLKELAPAGVTLTQFALRWVQMFPEVTCSIPGGKRPNQIEENCLAADLPELTTEQMAGVRQVYDELVRAQVHQRW